MKTIKIKRLFNGLASIRSFDKNNCVKKGEGIRFICGEEQMTLTPKQVEEDGFRINKKLFTSKHGTPPYFLIDYRWNPDAKETETKTQEKTSKKV